MPHGGCMVGAWVHAAWWALPIHQHTPFYPLKSALPFFTLPTPLFPFPGSPQILSKYVLCAFREFHPPATRRAGGGRGPFDRRTGGGHVRLRQGGRGRRDGGAAAGGDLRRLRAAAHVGASAGGRLAAEQAHLERVRRDDLVGAHVAIPFVSLRLFVATQLAAAQEVAEALGLSVAANPRLQ